MKQSHTYTKWFSRIAFCVLLILIGYAVIQPHFNSAYLVPHSLMRYFNASYESILAAERNIDAVLHLVGAVILTWTVWLSKLPILCKKPEYPAGLIALCCIAAEAWQFQIGRGWQSSDLLLGILGCFMAYLTMLKIKHLLS